MSRALTAQSELLTAELCRGSRAGTRRPKCGQERKAQRWPSLKLRIVIGFALITSAGRLLAEDGRPPELKALRFWPETIATMDGTEVTVSFSVTDDISSEIYVEAAFLDASGALYRSASKFASTLSPTDSLKVSFPRFTKSGVWTLSHLFISDTAGNTLSLGTSDLSRRGFPTRLEVTSTEDIAPPRLRSLDFIPARIDTSSGPAEVRVNYTVEDDLSGVNYIELTYRSPSGAIRRRSSAKFPAARLVSSSMSVNFPGFSEAGQWMLSSVFLSDVAGNTLVLDEKALAGLVPRMALEVISTQDTESPTLTALRVSPHAIDTETGPATARVEYTAADDISGVRSIEVVFLSPSGSIRRSGLALLTTPAKVVTNSVDVTFPRGSESGRWNLSSVFLSDAAGNTRILDTSAVASMGFPVTLTLNGLN
jgi:hypothetical protein